MILLLILPSHLSSPFAESFFKESGKMKTNKASKVSMEIEFFLKTIRIVGFCRVDKAVARRAGCFRGLVLVFDPFIPQEGGGDQIC